MQLRKRNRVGKAREDVCIAVYEVEDEGWGLALKMVVELFCERELRIRSLIRFNVDYAFEERVSRLSECEKWNDRMKTCFFRWLNAVDC